MEARAFDDRLVVIGSLGGARAKEVDLYSVAEAVEHIGKIVLKVGG